MYALLVVVAVVNSMRVVISLLINTLALLVTAMIVPGFKVVDFWAAVWAAIALGLLNTFLRPVLILFTLPANILTLGLFSWVISAAVIWLASLLVPGFDIDGFLPALVGGIITAFTASLLNSLLKR